MSDLFRLIWCGLIGLFRSRAALEAEILLLRHQLNILRRASPKPVALGSIDRLVFVGLFLRCRTFGLGPGHRRLRRFYSRRLRHLACLTALSANPFQLPPEACPSRDRA